MSHNRVLLRRVWIYEPEQVYSLYRHRFHEKGWFVTHRITIERCARSINPATPSSALNAMVAVSYFFRWAVENHLSLEMEDLFHPDTVEWYISDYLARLSPLRATTHRSMLRRIGPEVTRHAPWRPKPEAFTRLKLKAPYSARQTTGFDRILTEQPTEKARRIFAAILYLCLGAGLRGPEVALVHAHHVTRHDGCVSVRVEGPKPRDVPVRHEYAQQLFKLAVEYPEGPLVGHVRENEKDVTSKLKRCLKVPDWSPSFVPARLRTTWMVNVLNGDVRLSAVLEAVGVEGHSLRDLVPHLTERDDPDDEAVRLAGGLL
ncbi:MULTISPECIES: hypothetical protein [unclassified Frondihabitans]|uniref:hypothetical protein n=1 Tax=unclassified Frondihabitans TaxID=2626248 RepID=UPI000F504BDE|nr:MULTISPECIES: hypothetical protein [unclassified Frondihabitans]RPE77868.1 hypothetical protein EDF37_0533 [Frondihabitans sp. PhB153]RPF08147.1 hypothetical protein EDF39_0534 [Frondihabitans sp. PhB161]